MNRSILGNGFLVALAGTLTLCLQCLAHQVGPLVAMGSDRFPSHDRQSVKNPATMVDKMFYKEQQLPDLPKFAGQSSFISGYSQESELQNIVLMTWNIKEDTVTVYQWYRQALENFGWKIVTDNAPRLKAKKGQIRCFVLVQPSRDSGYRTRLVISLTSFPGQ